LLAFYFFIKKINVCIPSAVRISRDTKTKVREQACPYIFYFIRVLCGTFMGTDMATIKMLTRLCPKREWRAGGAWRYRGAWPYLNIISFFIILSWQRRSRTINKYTHISIYPYIQKNLKKRRRRLGDNDV